MADSNIVVGPDPGPNRRRRAQAPGAGRRSPTAAPLLDGLPGRRIVARLRADTLEERTA
jgi:hypothetical protein